MKPFFTILISLLLGLIPAEASFPLSGFETGCAACSHCHCGVQQNTARPLPQSVPATTTSVSLKRFTQEAEPLSTPVVRPFLLKPTVSPDPIFFTAAAPLFERYCSLLI